MGLGIKRSRDQELAWFSGCPEKLMYQLVGYLLCFHGFCLIVHFFLTPSFISMALTLTCRTTASISLTYYLDLKLTFHLMGITVFYFERWYIGDSKEPLHTPNRQMSKYSVIFINNFRLTVQDVEQTLLNVTYFNWLLYGRVERSFTDVTNSLFLCYIPVDREVESKKFKNVLQESFRNYLSREGISMIKLEEIVLLSYILVIS